jgi:two-component system CheB/CheR fusion protein
MDHSMSRRSDTTEAAGHPTHLSLVDAQPVEEPVRREQLSFPTVGIGASAGGVDALRRLFGAMPEDAGCAFVVVMHLAPERESMLAPLLGRSTRMPVAQVHESTRVEANHVYIAPPGQYLAMNEGRLQLQPIGERPHKPAAVDHFMVSLAADQRERAIGVVLTGVDGDGSLGIKAIKSEGGMTIAQSPESAAHPGMPESAIATGLIDQQLAIEAMPAAIVDYINDAALRHGGAHDDSSDKSLLPDILNRVRAELGLDFRGYKLPMLLRRVRRRMGLAHVRDARAYLELLSNRSEVNALAGDFLISVTEFFREPEAWVVLAKEVVPALLERKEVGGAVRAWCPPAPPAKRPTAWACCCSSIHGSRSSA